jgi:hypothetical protein
MRNDKYLQNLNRIEIEIFTGCNLRCRQCDRSSAQAASNEGMTIEQVALFVQESIALDWLWHEIEVLGGEPTLHPEFPSIIEPLRDYILFNPDCTVILVSNGYGKHVKQMLGAVPDFVTIDNTMKEPVNIIPFNRYNLAPIDDAAYENDAFTRGCRIVSECDLGLNRYGYYLCGAGASIDRVFGYGIGIPSLSSVSHKNLYAQRKTLCKICRHYKGRNLKIRAEDEVSPSWRLAYERYRIVKPNLALYGSSVLPIEEVAILNSKKQID